MPDAGDHGLKQPTAFRRTQGTETKRVGNAQGAGAHSEDVPQNAAYAGGRALKRFHGAGMIVGFNLEGDGQPVANVHNAGVFFSGTH